MAPGEIPLVAEDGVSIEGLSFAEEVVALSLTTKEVVIEIFSITEDVVTGDGAGGVFFVVPSTFNGLNLIDARFDVYTAGTTGSTTISLMRKRSGSTVDMLSTLATIETTETSSKDGTPLVIDLTKDDVSTGDVLTFGVDSVSTTKPKGLIATLLFEAPSV